MDHQRYQNTTAKDVDYYQRHPNMGNNNSNNGSSHFNSGMHRNNMEGGPRDREQHQMPSNYNNGGSGGSFDGGMQRSNNSNTVAPPRPHQVPPEGYVCRLCNIPGHWIQACPTNSNNSGGGFNNGMHRNNNTEAHHHQPPEGYICRLCNVPGHWIQVCPSKKMDQRHSSTSNMDSGGRGDYSRLADTVSSSGPPPPPGRMERRVPNYREESYQPHRFQEPHATL